MKVKIFNTLHEKDLEGMINDFIEEIEKEHMEVKDIKYSTVFGDSHWGDELIHYSALIMYKPDGKIYMTTPNYEPYREELLREDGMYECREIYKEVV